MTDYYLSFPDEATAKALLYRTEGAVEATDTTEAVEGYEVGNYLNIDTIGVIYKPTGETDEEVMEPIPGWHVNIRLMPGEDPAPFAPYQVNPVTPMRVWG
jgi:hypothetical protein